MLISNKLQKFILGTAQYGDPYGILNVQNIRVKPQVINKILKKITNKIHIIDTSEDYNIEKKTKRKFNKFIVNTKIEKSLLNKPYKFLSKVFSRIVKDYSINTLFIRNLENNECNKNTINKINFLKKKFTIKKIGISVYDFKNIKKLYGNFSYDVIQIPCNIFDNRSDKFKSFFSKNKIEVHARSIFLQGLAFSDEKLLRYKFKKYSKNILSLQKLAKKKKISLPNLCISHVFNKRYVSKIIFGVMDLKQLNLILNFKLIKNTSFLKEYSTTNKGLIDPRMWFHKND